MKGFGIYIKNDLLEPKHYKNMGESLWLYMWLIDHMTTVNENGVGKVLGNKPITYSEVNLEIGMSRNTYVRWVDRLRDTGYINTLRTPNGLVITVNKAKKGHKSDVPKTNITKKSDAPHLHSDVPNINTDVPNINMQYKTKQGLNKTKQQNADFLLEKKEQIAKNRKPGVGYKHAASIADEIKRRRLSK